MKREYTEYAQVLWTTQPKPDMTKVRSGLADAYQKATWDSGRREHATREQNREVRDAMRAFIRARNLSDPRVHTFYLAWCEAKDRVRAQLTKDGWRALVNRIGKQEGLDAVGVFSVLRFTTS